MDLGLMKQAIEEPSSVMRQDHENAKSYNASIDELLASTIFKALQWRLTHGRLLNKYGWWSNTVRTSEELKAKVHEAVTNGVYIDAVVYSAMLYMRSI